MSTERISRAFSYESFQQYGSFDSIQDLKLRTAWRRSEEIGRHSVLVAKEPLDSGKDSKRRSGFHHTTTLCLEHEQHSARLERELVEGNEALGTKWTGSFPTHPREALVLVPKPQQIDRSWSKTLLRRGTSNVRGEVMDSGVSCGATNHRFLILSACTDHFVELTLGWR
jgi:hypothetical protein